MPFDLRSYPVQIYEAAVDSGSNFARRLEEIATRHAAGELRFGNPIRDFLPTIDTNDTSPSLETEHNNQELVTDYGYLDFEVDMQENGGMLLSQFSRLGELNDGLTADIRALAPVIKRARAASDTKTERSLTNDVAELLQVYARTVRAEVLPAFHEGWEGVGHAMQWMAAQKPKDAPEATTADFCAEAQRLRDTLSNVIASVVGVRDSVLTGQGRTGKLDKAIREADAVFNDLVGDVMLGDAVLAKVQDRLGCRDPIPT